MNTKCSFFEQVADYDTNLIAAAAFIITRLSVNS